MTVRIPFDIYTRISLPEVIGSGKPHQFQTSNFLILFFGMFGERTFVKNSTPQIHFRNWASVIIEAKSVYAKLINLNFFFNPVKPRDLVIKYK